MRRTICKWFFTWDFKKEERWLNEMAAKGLALISVSFCAYTFEQTDPGEYGVRLELLEYMPSNPESEQYIRFLESTGVEHVGSMFRWAYFRKKRAEGEFDLFSDYACRIRHLNRMLALLCAPGMIWVAYAARYISQIWMNDTETTDVFMAVLAGGLTLLFGYGAARILLMKRKLKREHRLYE